MASTASQSKPGYAFRLPLRTERELAMFVRAAWGLEVPNKRVCEKHTTPWRAFADAYFARHLSSGRVPAPPMPVSVWKASRGLGGKTHLLAALALTEAVTLESDVNLLGGSGAQSGRVLESMDKFWSHENAPTGLLLGEPAQRHTVLRGSMGERDKIKIHALLASQAQVRGAHPPRLRMDEIDEMNIKILDGAMGQPQRGVRNIVPQVVLSSTHQHSFGTMTEILKRAKRKGWPVYEWCYRETAEPHGWLQREDIDDKRAMLTEVMWKSEVELQEPSPTDRFIHPDKVAKMFDRDLGECEDQPGEYYEFEPPKKGATYATGADWAKDVDWTIVVTLRVDRNPARVVAYFRDGRVPYPEMIKGFHYQQKRYGSFAAHDATGVGNAVTDFLTIPAEPVTLVGKTRLDLLVNYRDAVERREVISPFIEHMEEEHRLASRLDVFKSEAQYAPKTGEKRHHLPDTICAAALAWKASALRAGPAIY